MDRSAFTVSETEKNEESMEDSGSGPPLGNKPKEKGVVDKRKSPEEDRSLDTSEVSLRPKKKFKMSQSQTGDDSQHTNVSVEDEDILKDDDSKTLDAISESAEEKLLASTAEGDSNFPTEGKDDGNDSGDSSNSDKFYSQIKEMEEKDKGHGPQSVVPDDTSSRPTLSAVSGLDNVSNIAVANWTENNNKYAGTISSESSSPDYDKVHLQPLSRQVHVYLKIVEPNTNDVIYETKGDLIKTQLGAMRDFLEKHHIDISASSSGYAGDVSSQEPDPVVFQRPRDVSLGSTIARPSDASVLSRPSIKPAQPATPKGQERGEDGIGPLLNSTRVDPKSKIGSKLVTESTLKDEAGSGLVTVRYSGEDSSGRKTPFRKVGKVTPRRATPGSSGRGGKKRRAEGPSPVANLKKSTSTTRSSVTESEMDSDVLVKSEPSEEQEQERKRVKAQRSKGLASQKSIQEFKDTNYIKSGTLWGTVGAGEAVFARWRDRSYYSGRISKKGMNDTWQIHFEDGIEDVASETHILPIKILGIGTWTVYCPPEEYKPEVALIVGQKFLDSNDDLEKIEYAVKSNIDGRIIICYRKNLTLAETDAREMRKNYQIQEVTKTADLSLENIVSGPRRRCGGTSPTPSTMLRKLVAGTFDVSSSDGAAFKDAGTPIPKKLGSKEGRRGSSSRSSSHGSDEMSSGSASSSNLGTKTPKTSAATKETAKSSAKKGSTKKERTLFQNMQFYLTASGGVENTAENSVPILPYDKDEYREGITANGGVVLDLVGNENKKGGHVYLISDNYARTVKYIYAIAGGIPCVSYKWIEECLRVDSVVDYKAYALDSGMSLESELMIPAHGQKPLKGVNIYVIAESDELFNYWEPVLTAAEANLLRVKPAKNKKPVLIPPGTEILVTDSTCTSEVLELADKNGIPYVKPEWLVQTIITGKRADYSGHDKYRIE